MSNIPSCCGRKMKLNLELGRFLEILCEECNDIVYVKAYSENRKPIMLDD